MRTRRRGGVCSSRRPLHNDPTIRNDRLLNVTTTVTRQQPPEKSTLRSTVLTSNENPSTCPVALAHGWHTRAPDDGPVASHLRIFRLDNRQKSEPTSGLEPLTCSLRVINQALLGCAEDCRSRISRRFPLLRVAECCTVLRSRWYQSGINRGIAAPRFCSVVVCI